MGTEEHFTLEVGRRQPSLAIPEKNVMEKRQRTDLGYVRVRTAIEVPVECREQFAPTSWAAENLQQYLSVAAVGLACKQWVQDCQHTQGALREAIRSPGSGCVRGVQSCRRVQSRRGQSQAAVLEPALVGNRFRPALFDDLARMCRNERSKRPIKIEYGGVALATQNLIHFPTHVRQLKMGHHAFPRGSCHGGPSSAIGQERRERVGIVGGLIAARRDKDAARRRDELLLAAAVRTHRYGFHCHRFVQSLRNALVPRRQKEDIAERQQFTDFLEAPRSDQRSEE